MSKPWKLRTHEEKEAHRKYNRDWYRNNTRKVLFRTNNFKKSLQEEVILSYGEFCNCCGENELKFLTLDHVHNDGTQHRKQVKGARGVYQWAKDNNYPDCLQVLCHNCNSGKHRNGGVCPHVMMTPSLVGLAKEQLTDSVTNSQIVTGASTSPKSCWNLNV